MKTVAGSQYHDWKQRALEIATGSMAWVFFATAITLSYFSILWAAYLLVAYTVFWLIKIFGYSYRLVRGFWYIQLTKRLDWQLRLNDLHDVKAALIRTDERIKRHDNFLFSSAWRYYRRLLLRAEVAGDKIMDPDEIHHAVIIAQYNENPEILESTLKILKNCRYEKSRMILVVAYEERGGEEVEKNVIRLVKEYGPEYKKAMAVKHPDGIPGEAKGKAGNITIGAQELNKYVAAEKLDPAQVIVTTLDVDNRPDPQYFAETAFMYAITPERIRRSFQPIPMFFNNIWDAPALIRVIAVSNSFWVLMEALRPHRLRNFSAHGQSLQTLIDTDYWNVASIVEDGHQYWRTYFTYKGDHKVLPIYSPIFQDAVLVEGYWRTFKAQFYQLRRWAWGVADTPYVIRRSWHEREIPWSNKLVHIGRQIEGYFSWVAAPLILAFGGWLPLFIHADATDSVLAQQLPKIVSYIQTGALIGLVAPIITSLITMPPRPPRYGIGRSLMMVLQWAFVPVTLIAFGSMAALNAQTRLMLGKYLETFNVTEKKRVEDPTVTGI